MNAHPSSSVLTAAVILASLLASVVGAGAHAASAGGQEHPVRLEPVAGKDAKRVILSAKAAERLGIEVGQVREAPVMRTQMVSGLVVRPLDTSLASNLAAEPGAVPRAVPPVGVGFAGFTTVANPQSDPRSVASNEPGSASGDVWVLVSLSPGELERLARDRPARLLPLATRAEFDSEVFARPTGLPPQEDLKRAMLSLYYAVPRAQHPLTINTRLRVELPMQGDDGTRKVVPYSAVYYDARGEAWIYVASGSLTFERQRVAIERVAGDMAVLSDGPSLGTPVVTVGAALLYGAEVFGK